MGCIVLTLSQAVIKSVNTGHVQQGAARESGGSSQSESYRIQQDYNRCIHYMNGTAAILFLRKAVPAQTAYFAATESLEPADLLNISSNRAGPH